MNFARSRLSHRHGRACHRKSDVSDLRHLKERDPARAGSLCRSTSYVLYLLRRRYGVDVPRPVFAFGFHPAQGWARRSFVAKAASPATTKERLNESLSRQRSKWANTIGSSRATTTPGVAVAHICESESGEQRADHRPGRSRGELTPSMHHCRLNAPRTARRGGRPGAKRVVSKRKHPRRPTTSSHPRRQVSRRGHLASRCPNSLSQSSRSECRQSGIRPFPRSSGSIPRPSRACLRGPRSTSHRSRRDRPRGLSRSRRN